MAILSKIYIIACLLLNVLMCQRQEYLDYSLDRHHPEALAMPKYSRSYDWEDNNPIWNSQMGVAICPAENPNNLRFENYPNVKMNWQNIVKDEDDGEDLDMAARGDDDDDDDEDDPAFVARIACLLSSLDQHIKAIVCNVNNIETHLTTGIFGKTHEDKEPQHETKCSKKTDNFQEKQKYNQDNFNEASGQNLDTGLNHLPFHVQVPSMKMKDFTPPAYGMHSQNGGDLSLPGYGIHSPNGLQISPPGYGIPLQKIIYPLPENYNHEPYEEYETKLRRLIANRDAIERNVMRILAPRQGERM